MKLNCHPAKLQCKRVTGKKTRNVLLNFATLHRDNSHLFFLVWRVSLIATLVNKLINPCGTCCFAN